MGGCLTIMGICWCLRLSSYFKRGHKGLLKLIKCNHPVMGFLSSAHPTSPASWIAHKGAIVGLVHVRVNTKAVDAVAKTDAAPVVLAFQLGRP